MQVELVARQGLVEHAEVAAVLNDGLDRSKPLQVFDLDPTQLEADPLLQPVGLLLQAAIDGQLLKQLEPQENGGQRRLSSRRIISQGEELQYFGPLLMNIHGSQQDMSRSIHS